MGEIYLQQRLHSEAIAAFERAVSLSPGLSRPLAWLGHAYAVAGEDQRARRTLEQLQAISARAPVSPYDIALIHLGRNDTEQAFAWLEKAYEKRASDLIQLSVDRRFERLHGDPRYADLLRRIGIPARS